MAWMPQRTRIGGVEPMHNWGYGRAHLQVKWVVRSASDDLIAPDGKTVARVVGLGSRTAWRIEMADGRVTTCRDRFVARREAERLTRARATG
jgi:hypothetical protein